MHIQLILLGVIALIILLLWFIPRISRAWFDEKQRKKKILAEENKMEDEGNVMVAGIGILVLAVVAFGFAFAASTTVEAGERAVVYDVWDGSSYVIEPGWSMINPVTKDVYAFNVQNRIHRVEAEGVTGKGDLQVVKTEVAVRYHLNVKDVNRVFFEFKTRDTEGLQDICIDPKVQDAVKAVVANYTYSEVATDYRAEAKRDIIHLLNDPQTGLPSCYLTVESVDITDFDASEEVNKALEAKARAKQEYEQTVIEANKRVAEAEADFRSAQLRANAIVVEAEAKARAAEVIQAQITPDYLEYLKILQWNGRVPETYVQGSQTGLLMNLP